MKRFYAASAAVLALFLVLAVPLGALAAGSQIWYLGSGSSSAGYTMVKQNASTQSGSVTVPVGGTVVWIANQVSQGVTFSSGTWFADIATDAVWGTFGTDCVVKIGRWGSGGFSEFSLTQAYQGQWSEAAATHILKVDVQMISEEVEDSDYLALQITNNSGSQRVIYTGEGSQASCLKSPQTDPGYPLPELAAGVLFGIGLIGLGGFVLLRRKRLAKSNN
jgi:hypothetical protein